MTDVTSPTSVNRFNENYLSDLSNDTDDDEEFQTVAPPSTTQFMIANTSIRSPPPPQSALSHESSTTENAQTCSDPIGYNGHTQLTSPIMTTNINPFQQWHLLQQQRRSQQNDDNNNNNNSVDNILPEISPSIGSPLAVSSPVDIRSLLAHESNRLDTFKKQNRDRFADVDVAHLAYVGFFLNGEGTIVQCPWCDVHLTEQQFEDIIRSRPSVARSALSNEPWTPMRVHRHANGILMDQNHPWCTWVRREAGGLYPNVTMVYKISFLSLQKKK